MSFITYFIPHENRVFRCCADESEKEYFLALGAKLTREEAESDINVECIPSGDSGSGEFGSNEWHESCLLEMTAKGDILSYMSKLGIDDYDKRGGVEIVKEKAIKAIYDRDSG